jgi:hypothetical protein
MFVITSARRSDVSAYVGIKSGRPRRYNSNTALLESGLGYGYATTEPAEPSDTVGTTSTVIDVTLMPVTAPTEPVSTITSTTTEATPMTTSTPSAATTTTSTAIDVAILFLIALSVMVTVGGAVIAHLYVLGKHFITKQLGQPLVTELGYVAQTIDVIASNAAATVEAATEQPIAAIKALYTTEVDITAAVSVISLIVAGWVYSLERLATMAARLVCRLLSWEASVTISH